MRLRTVEHRVHPPQAPDSVLVWERVESVYTASGLIERALDGCWSPDNRCERQERLCRANSLSDFRLMAPAFYQRPVMPAREGRNLAWQAALGASGCGSLVGCALGTLVWPLSACAGALGGTLAGMLQYSALVRAAEFDQGMRELATIGREAEMRQANFACLHRRLQVVRIDHWGLGPSFGLLADRLRELLDDESRRRHHLATRRP